MLIGLNKDNDRVIAVKGYSEEVYCPECGELLVNRVNGEVNIPHFAHKPDSSCNYGKGESLPHMQCKVLLKEKIEKYNKCTVSELEYRLPMGLIADYYAEIEGKKICFEVINTHYDFDKIKTYQENGYYVCIVFIDRYIKNTEVKVNDFEKLAHYMNFGIIYSFDYEDNSWWRVHFDTVVRESGRCRFEEEPFENCDSCPKCWIRTYYPKKIRSVDKKKLRNFKIVSFNSGEFNSINYLRAGFYNKKWW